MGTHTVAFLDCILGDPRGDRAWAPASDLASEGALDLGPGLLGPGFPSPNPTPRTSAFCIPAKEVADRAMFAPAFERKDLQVLYRLCVAYSF